MQNILCFGVFARDDAFNNCCDSRLNINCYPAKRGQNHLNCHPSSEIRGLFHHLSPLSDCKERIRGLRIFNKTSKMPNSDAQGVFGHDRFIIRHDNYYKLSPLSDCKERIRGLRISKNNEDALFGLQAVLRHDRFIIGHDRFIIRHDNKGLAGRRLLW